MNHKLKNSQFSVQKIRFEINEEKDVKCVRFQTEG